VRQGVANVGDTGFEPVTIESACQCYHLQKCPFFLLLRFTVSPDTRTLSRTSLERGLGSPGASMRLCVPPRVPKAPEQLALAVGVNQGASHVLAPHDDGA
jgi:hypothetical protein